MPTPRRCSRFPTRPTACCGATGLSLWPRTAPSIPSGILAPRKRTVGREDFGLAQSRPPRPAGGRRAPADGAPGQPAYVQFPWGSTGRPRGIAAPWPGIHANVEAVAARAPVTPRDHLVSWLPMYHDMGVFGGLLPPLHVGASFTLL